MPTRKISQLTLIDAVSAADVLAIVNDGVTQKCTVTQLLALSELLANKGQASGYAALDASSLVPLVNVPTITLDKISPASAASRLLGRGSASGGGAFEEITLGSGLLMVGTELSASGGASGGAYGFDALYPLTEPVDADFSWVNQSGASVAAGPTGGVKLTGVTPNAGLHLRVKSAPATPYVITAAIIPLTGTQTAAGAAYGIGFRQSSDGKLSLLYLHHSDQGEVMSIKFTNPTTFLAVYASGQSGQAVAVSTFGPLQSLYKMRVRFPINWLRIADNGTNRILSVSADGIEWVVFHTIGRTDFLTADQVGWFVGDVSNVTSSHLISWKQE